MLWMWIFPSTHPLFHIPFTQGLPSALSRPHPRERLWAGPPQAGWGADAAPSLPASLIRSCRVSWLWPPSRAAPFCHHPRLLPPAQTALISICQQLVERQTDTRSLSCPPLFRLISDSPAPLPSPWGTLRGLASRHCPCQPFPRPPPALCVCGVSVWGLGPRCTLREGRCVCGVCPYFRGWRLAHTPAPRVGERV